MDKPKVLIISNGSEIKQVLTNIREDINIEVEIWDKSKHTSYENLDQEIVLKQDGFRDILNH